MDVLLVIDDSQSMEPAQRALSRALPAFFFELLAGAGFPAPSSLRIGVVTSSDAALPVVRGPLGTGCMLRAAEPRWFAFPSSDLPTLPALMDAIECAAAPGTNGNMVEQPLEAAANQLTRTSDFFRAEAVTFVFFVTDEDDCSLLPGSSELRLDDRCKHSDELQPLDRYIRAFEGFRPHGHAIYALLGPLPPDEEDPDPQALLEHPFMQWEDGRSHGGAVRIVRVLHESASASSVLASIYECVDPEEYCRGRRRPHDLEPSFLDRRVHVHDCNQNHPCPAYDLRTDLDDLEPIWRRVGEPLTASGCGDP